MIPAEWAVLLLRMPDLLSELQQLPGNEDPIAAAINLWALEAAGALEWEGEHNGRGQIRLCVERDPAEIGRQLVALERRRLQYLREAKATA